MSKIAYPHVITIIPDEANSGLFFASIKFLHNETKHGAFAEGASPAEAVAALYTELAKQGFYL
jgi:hypothetical protein